MAWIAADPWRFQGMTVGDGQCVAYVRAVCGAPHTSTWRAGAVPTIATPTGTAIATFNPDGRYGNHTDGRSHTAVLLSVRPEGLHVMDQWVGRKVATRVIRSKRGQGLACDDGDQYRVIEHSADAGPAAA
jgi:hypothetical protein